MKRLRQDLFTNQSNTARSIEGWKIAAPINTLDGNDKVEGIAKGDIYGIRFVDGSLDTASGNDVVSGRARSNGTGIYTDEDSAAVIKTGTGSDKIMGTAGSDGYGIFFWNTESKIITGSGDDRILGSGGERGFGIVHYGTIDTGNGRDVIKGTSGGDGQGLFIGNGPQSAILKTGAGKDRVIGKAGTGESVDIHISSNSAIHTGSGDDKVTGSGSGGIYNDGNMRTGKGNDKVDALIGGFSGTGATNLGTGNDTLIGFGGGFFDAGGGIDFGTQSDRILLPEGVYSVSTTIDESGYFVLSRVGAGAEMLIKGFEFIGSASAPSAISEFILIPTSENSNSIIIDSTGVQIIA
jgi:hypothetical protein